jgi:hypothetical protein
MVAMIGIIVISGYDRADRFYHNKKGKIVSMNGDNSLTKDKFHKPVSCANVLIQDLEDTTLFVELSSCDYTGLINKEWYYNHHVGDIVSFKDIHKEIYFHIK